MWSTKREKRRIGGCARSDYESMMFYNTIVGSSPSLIAVTACTASVVFLVYLAEAIRAVIILVRLQDERTLQTLEC